MGGRQDQDSHRSDGSKQNKHAAIREKTVCVSVGVWVKNTTMECQCLSSTGQQSDPKGDKEPCCVSMKSDQSIGNPPVFSSGGGEPCWVEVDDRRVNQHVCNCTKVLQAGVNLTEALCKAICSPNDPALAEDFQNPLGDHLTGTPLLSVDTTSQDSLGDNLPVTPPATANDRSSSP
ncbi:hypothetical protein AOLI_G00326420 [Acnodon oligacanthus]